MNTTRIRAGRVLAFCAALMLAAPVAAEVTVSRSNAPQATLGGQVAALLGQERRALSAVGPERMQAVAALPAPRGKARAPAAPQIVYDAGWLATLPAPSGGTEWQCLTKAIYFEARGESIQGQVAVAEVILNRVAASSFPDSICRVVQQGNARGCQFSYACDGKPEVAADRAAWDTAGRIARLMLDGAPRRLTQGATHFHSRAVRPAWASRFTRTAVIGAHLFYRAPSAG